MSASSPSESSISENARASSSSTLMLRLVGCLRAPSLMDAREDVLCLSSPSFGGSSSLDAYFSSKESRRPPSMEVGMIGVAATANGAGLAEGALTPNGIMDAPPMAFIRSAIDIFFSPASPAGSFSAAGLAVLAAGVGAGVSSFFIQDGVLTFATGLTAAAAAAAVVDEAVVVEVETGAALLLEAAAGVAAAGVGAVSVFLAQGNVPDFTGSTAAFTTGFSDTTVGVAGALLADGAALAVGGVDMVSSARLGRDRDLDGCAVAEEAEEANFPASSDTLLPTVLGVRFESYMASSTLAVLAATCSALAASAVGFVSDGLVSAVLVSVFTSVFTSGLAEEVTEAGAVDADAVEVAGDGVVLVLVLAGATEREDPLAARKRDEKPGNE